MLHVNLPWLLKRKGQKTRRVEERNNSESQMCNAQAEVQDHVDLEGEVIAEGGAMRVDCERDEYM